MLHAVLKSLREEFGREIGTSEHAVNCHHNSSLEEHFGEQVWITRKWRCRRTPVSSASSRAAWVRVRSSCA